MLKKKALWSGLVLALAMVISGAAEAGRGRGDDRSWERRGKGGDRGSIQNPRNPSQKVEDDRDLVRAVQDKRNVFFVEAANVVVTQILPDDTQGLPHQRWYVKLSNGQQVFCVYNLNMGGRIPIHPGSVIAVGGEFKWTERGALIHWLHSDPSNRRPDGYVEFDGVRYGQE